MATRPGGKKVVDGVVGVGMDMGGAAVVMGGVTTAQPLARGAGEAAAPLGPGAPPRVPHTHTHTHFFAMEWLVGPTQRTKARATQTKKSMTCAGANAGRA